MEVLKIGKTSYLLENVKKCTKEQFIKIAPHVEQSHLDLLIPYFLAEDENVKKASESKTKKASE